MADNGKGKGHDEKIDFTIIVNGQEAKVKARESERLGSLIPPALEETGNSGQPPENWELRDEQGTLLEPERLIGDFNFPKKVRLFLNLKAGVGG
jgi:hypothetical protein